MAKNRKFSKKSIKNLLLRKLFGQLGPNFGGMVLGWSPFRIVSDDPAHQSRWPPWLKIENSAKKSFKVFFSETAWQIETKPWLKGPWMFPFRIVSDDPTHQPRWPPWLKIENSAKKSLKIFFSETAWPIWTKLWWNGPWVVPFQDCIRRPHPPWLKIENSANKSLKIFFSETVSPIGTKLWWNGPWVVPFQDCIRQPGPPTKMAAMAKNRKFGKKIIKNLLLWNCSAIWHQTLLERSLGGPLSGLYPTTLPANQDGRHG